MFLYPVNTWKTGQLKRKILAKSNLNKNQKRKAKLSPLKVSAHKKDTGAFFFAPLNGTLTVEAALVLPLFLFVMISVMQYGAVMETAVKFGTSLAETGKTMATAAYVTEYGGNTEEIPDIVTGALSAAYAQGQVKAQAGDTSAVKNINLLQSSILQEDDMIDLVLTYQIKSPISLVKLPGTFFLQRARVRAWTGRSAQVDGSAEEEASDEDYVYVTATGSVYHEDPDCTHLKLSIRAVDAGTLETLRNNNGGIYHDCEICGGANGSGTVYVTNEGNRCHNSLSCSGLKRTVRQVARAELGNMRACSKCGKLE